MAKHLERELTELNNDLLSLAASVEGAVLEAVRAQRQRDAGLAREVIDGDDDIDDAENRIQRECLRLLALYQPVARDLRRVTAALGVTTDLERLGDLAVSIAGRAASLAVLPPADAPAGLEELAGRATALLRGALEAFAQADAEKARAVCRAKRADRPDEEIISRLTRAMKERPEIIEQGLSLYSVVQQLRRVAGHATNIAEWVIYLVEGEVVRHRPEALGASAAPNVPNIPGVPGTPFQSA
jgi:phosphate transport system protein